MEKEYSGLIDISDIFTYQTVAGMAAYLERKLRPESKPKARMSSEDDIDRILIGLAKGEITAEEAEQLINLKRDKPIAQIAASIDDDNFVESIPDSGSGDVHKTGDTQSYFSPNQLNPFYDLKDFQPFVIDQPETKVLQIQPHNEITTYLSHALPLCVVLADPKLMPWYYEHFIDLYSITDEKDYLKLDFLEYRAAYKEVMNEVYLGYNLLKNEPNIIQFIIDKINLGYYVIIHADEYYLSVKRWYQKEHFVHHSIIYGYHNANQKLMAVGFDAEQLFTQITFDYDTFAEAFEQGKLYYKQSAPWAENNAVELLKLKDYQEEYPFDIRLFLKKLDGYLASTGDAAVIFSYNWKLDKNKVAYGLNVYQQIVDHLENLLKGQFTIDYRAIHLLYEHKKSIYQRLQYILGRYPMAETLVKMVRDYSRIVEQAEAIRRKSSELNYIIGPSGPNEPSYVFGIIQETITAIKLIKEAEQKLLQEIYDQIQLEIR